MMKMRNAMHIARTVIESAVVLCASGLAALTFSDGFCAFAAVCAFIAIAMQALVCLRTRLHEKLEGKTCENCRWLEHSYKGYYYCKRFDGLDSIVPYPSGGVCEYWEDKPEPQNSAGEEKHCKNCRWLEIVDGMIPTCSLDGSPFSGRVIRRVNTCSCEFWKEDWSGRQRGARDDRS